MNLNGIVATICRRFPPALPLLMAAEETLVTAYWLVDDKAVEGGDYELANLIKVWGETNKQDGMLVECNQQGVRSSGCRPGPYSQETALDVIAFVEWYCGKMTSILGGRRQRVARIARSPAAGRPVCVLASSDLARQARRCAGHRSSDMTKKTRKCRAFIGHDAHITL